MHLIKNIAFFCWRLVHVSAFLALLHWTTTCCWGGGVAAASARPPGVVIPSDVEINIGGSANITCRIAEGGNSSTLWFSEENTKKRIEQPSTLLTVLDPLSVVLSIRNATEQKSRYQCMSGDKAIGVAMFYVGTPPTNVTDFSCKSYDYEYMKCSFSKPHNMIFTTYQLHYKLDNEYNNYSYNCEMQTIDYTYCNLSISSNEQKYLPTREYYYFYLTARNKLGSNTQVFAINNRRNVIPAKLEIELQNKTTDSITLHWNNWKISYYKEEGLEYEIRLQPKGFDWYYKTDYCNENTCQLILRDLRYPYRDYTIRVRVKVKTAADGDESGADSMWSEPFVATFRTEPRRPDKPPRTAVGAFYIDPMETQVRLYWQQLEEFDQNGPGFHYNVVEVDDEGNKTKTLYTNQTSIGFPWHRGKLFRYYIKASNDYGDSTESSAIIVYPSIEGRGQYYPNTIATVYHNRFYTLSWSPPDQQGSLVNYTVFWCLSKMESTNQCKGTMKFKYLDRSQTNFTTDSEDHTLNLAVSANFLDYNTGMHWARCSADVSSDLMKLEPEVTRVTDGNITLQWNSERVCTSILEGYNLSYCQVADNYTGEEEEESDCHLVMLRKEMRNYTIVGLKPFARYRISMFMYSLTKEGPWSDKLYESTKESAPSAPRGLQVHLHSVTSNSANISWQPPEITNGRLQYYTIWRRTLLSPGHIESQRVAANETHVKLAGLNSYTGYEVYVTAHTVEDSPPSNLVNFSTLIGRPTNPRDVATEEDGRYGILEWSAPAMPSGRVEFYVVSLIMKYKNLLTNKEGGGKDEQRIALVKGNRCRFRVPECVGSSYYLQVRAVNVAWRNEIDHDTFARTKLLTKRRRRHITEESARTVAATECLANADSFDSNFECLDAPPLDVRFTDYCSHLADVVGGDNERMFFASEWEKSKSEVKCVGFSKEDFMIVIFSVMLLLVLTAMFFWMRKEYNKMKNIKPVLPEGLVKFGGGGGPEPSSPGDCDGYDTSSEKDIYDVPPASDWNHYIHKESHSLLNSSASNNGQNVPSSPVGFNNFKESQMAQQMEPHSTANSNEEQTSESTVDSVASSVDCARPPGDYFTPSQMTAPGGYVTPATILLAAGHAADAAGFAAFSPSGYVQPEVAIKLAEAEPPALAPRLSPQMELAPPAPVDGYISLDALLKPHLAGEDAVALALVENPHKRHAVEAVPEVLPLENAGSNNNNNVDDRSNPNSIYGYVTQRQLAEFGQLVN